MCIHQSASWRLTPNAFRIWNKLLLFQLTIKLQLWISQVAMLTYHNCLFRKLSRPILFKFDKIGEHWNSSNKDLRDCICAVEVWRHSRWPLFQCRGFGSHNSVDVNSVHAQRLVWTSIPWQRTRGERTWHTRSDSALAKCDQRWPFSQESCGKQSAKVPNVNHRFITKYPPRFLFTFIAPFDFMLILEDVYILNKMASWHYDKKTWF